MAEWQDVKCGLQRSLDSTRVMLDNVRAACAAASEIGCGLAQAAGESLLLPRTVTDAFGSVRDGVLPAMEAAAAEALIRPHSVVLSVFSELETRLTARSAALAEFQAAQRALVAQQRRAAPRRGMMRMAPGAPSASQDEARQRAVERLAGAQQVLAGLDAMLREQLAAWVRHRAALAQGCARAATACVATHLASAGRAALAGGAAGFDGDASEEAEWWMPPELRSRARVSQALTVRIRGRDVREPPAAPSGAMLWLPDGAVSSDGLSELMPVRRRGGTHVADTGDSAAAASAPADGRARGLMARRCTEGGRLFLSRKLRPAAARALTTGRAERAVTLLDEDTVTDSEVGRRMGEAMAANGVAGLELKPGGAGSAVPGADGAFEARSRVLFRRRWLRRVCQGLGADDLCRMAAVCKRWAAVIRTDRELWLGCVWAGGLSASPRLRPKFWAWVTGAGKQAPPAWSRARGVVFLPSDVSADRSPGAGPDAWRMTRMPVCSVAEFNALLRAAAADVEARSDGPGEGGEYSWAATIEQDIRRTSGCVPGTRFGDFLGRRRPGFLHADTTHLAGPGHIAFRGDARAGGLGGPVSGGEDDDALTDSTPLADEDDATSGGSGGAEAAAARRQLELAMQAADDEGAPALAEPAGAESAGVERLRAARLRSVLLVGAQTFKVPYIQGLNHVAMMLLEHCAGEPAPPGGGHDAAAAVPWTLIADDGTAVAFTLLRQVMGGRGLESLLSKEMRQLGAVLFQLDALIHDQLPQLAAVLDRADVLPAMYAGPWILTLFASHRALPPAGVVVVWDAFLAGGWIEAYRAVLAVLTVLQPQLLAAAAAVKDDEDLMEVLLPVLQAPRGCLDGSDAHEAAFKRQVLAAAVRLRLRESRLRALAAAHVSSLAGASGTASGISGALRSRLGGVMHRFRRASARLRAAQAGRRATGAAAGTAAAGSQA